MSCEGGAMRAARAALQGVVLHLQAKQPGRAAQAKGKDKARHDHNNNNKKENKSFRRGVCL